MKRFLLTLALVLVLAPLLGGGSCASAGDTKGDGPPLPTLPDTVTVAVEVPKALPSELTDALARPKRKTGTLDSYKRVLIGWEAYADLVDCHRALSAKVSRGEKVNVATACAAYAPASQ